MTGRLSGKRALVTGAGRGIGAAIAHAFAAQGASVLVTDVDAASAEAVAAGIISVHGPASALACRLDVTVARDWAAALALAGEVLGGLSVLVNNAGVGTGGSIETLSLESWRGAFAVNVDGAFLGIQQALPLLRASQPAAIINIASSAALHARAEMAAYGASKAALWSLTRSVALHCAAQGWDIRCNAVLPAYVDTAILDAFRPTPETPRAKVAGWLSREVPLGRIATPRDIAEGAIYLASDESGFMTGAELKLDGGLSAL